MLWGRKNLECLGMIFSLEEEFDIRSPYLVDVVENIWDIFPDKLPDLSPDRERDRVLH